MTVDRTSDFCPLDASRRIESNVGTHQPDLALASNRRKAPGLRYPFEHRKFALHVCCCTIIRCLCSDVSIKVRVAGRHLKSVATVRSHTSRSRREKKLMLALDCRRMRIKIVLETACTSFDDKVASRSLPLAELNAITASLLRQSVCGHGS